MSSRLQVITQLSAREIDFTNKSTSEDVGPGSYIGQSEYKSEAS